MSVTKKNIWQMLAMVASSLLLGLGANFFSRDPLPLFRSLAASTAPIAPVGEVDDDFVQQVGNAPGTLLLDARAAAVFRRGHIPGAVSLPLGEFSALFSRLEPLLRQARLLVVYCSGWTCNDSRDLAGLLWARGLKNLLLYRGGMEDWDGKGHAVEK